MITIYIYIIQSHVNVYTYMGNCGLLLYNFELLGALFIPSITSHPRGGSEVRKDGTCQRRRICSAHAQDHESARCGVSIFHEIHLSSEKDKKQIINTSKKIVIGWFFGKGWRNNQVLIHEQRFWWHGIQSLFFVAPKILPTWNFSSRAPWREAEAF